MAAFLCSAKRGEKKRCFSSPMLRNRTPLSRGRV